MEVGIIFVCGLDSGAILAANVRACIQILKDVAPQATPVVWSDMFDPSHNAHDHYYLTKGSFAQSWEGLDPSVLIANWNSGKPKESLPWFAQRGYHQILAGYYDSDPKNILPWLQAVHDIPHIDGVMYTTWENNYTDLEKFAQIVRDYSSSKNTP